MIGGSDGLCGKQILKLKNVSSRGGKIGGLAPAVSRLCRCRRGAVEFLKCDVYFFSQLLLVVVNLFGLFCGEDVLQCWTFC